MATGISPLKPYGKSSPQKGEVQLLEEEGKDARQENNRNNDSYPESFTVLGTGHTPATRRENVVKVLLL